MPKSIEELKEQRRQYRFNNKDRIDEQMKIYRAANLENTKNYNKIYKASPIGKRKLMIDRWRSRGLVCDDYDELYDRYLKATVCEEEGCGITFGIYGDGSGTFRCMDHSHLTGEFREFVCCRCNLKRR